MTNSTSKSTTKKKKRKQLIKLILLGIGLVGFYFFIKTAYRVITEPQTESIIGQQQPETTPKELYQLLENTDTINLKAAIIVDRPTSLSEISKVFYGNECYWSYILEANPKIENILEIQAETRIVIPRIDSVMNMEDKGAEASRILGEKLLEKISEGQKSDNELDFGR